MLLSECVGCKIMKTNPDYLVYGKNLKNKWIRIGGAWNKVSTNTDRKFISVTIDTLPFGFDGSLMLHPNTRGMAASSNIIQFEDKKEEV